VKWFPELLADFIIVWVNGDNKEQYVNEFIVRTSWIVLTILMFTAAIIFFEVSYGS